MRVKNELWECQGSQEVEKVPLEYQGVKADFQTIITELNFFSWIECIKKNVTLLASSKGKGCKH